MKSIIKACSYAGFFAAIVVFNLCAMNILEQEKTQISDAIEPTFKELKLLAENNEYLKNVKFPEVIDKVTKMTLDQLDPEIIIQTDECKKILNKSQEEKDQALQDAFNLGRGDYSQRRFLFACALVAGADPNKGKYDKLVLLEAAVYKDYWLARLALLCGADPNKGFWRDKVPLEKAETVEMAKLLIYCGADVAKADDVLYKAVSLVWGCHWPLLEFYLTQKIKWKNEISPFLWLLSDVGYLENTDQEAAENYLRKMKLLFNAGYQVEDKFLKKLRETIKRPHLLQALILSALKTSKFDLHQFLYRLHNDDGYKEKNSMYLFAKNQNKTDVKLIYHYMGL